MDRQTAAYTTSISHIAYSIQENSPSVSIKYRMSFSLQFCVIFENALLALLRKDFYVCELELETL